MMIVIIADGGYSADAIAGP